MDVFFKSTQIVVSILKSIGMLCTALVMFVITIGVISRLLGFPLLGTVELAEILHLILIMFAFAYTQSLKEHISIGLLVDRFPKKVQVIFDIISHILTIFVCMLLSYIFLTITMETTKTTLLLDFPYIILKMIITIGFFAWGLISFAQLLMGLNPSVGKGANDV